MCPAKALTRVGQDPAVLKAIMKKQQEQAKRMRKARALLVSAWLVTNWAFATVFVELKITSMYVRVRVGMLVHQSSPTACRYALGVVMAYGSILVFRLLGSFVYRGQMVVYHCWRKGGSSHKIRVPRVATPTAWSEYTHGYAAPNSRGGASNVTDIEAASGFDGAGAGQRSCSDSDSYSGTRGGGTSASRASSRSRGRIHPSERL